MTKRVTLEAKLTALLKIGTLADITHEHIFDLERPLRHPEYRYYQFIADDVKVAVNETTGITQFATVSQWTDSLSSFIKTIYKCIE